MGVSSVASVRRPLSYHSLAFLEIGRNRPQLNLRPHPRLFLLSASSYFFLFAWCRLFSLAAEYTWGAIHRCSSRERPWLNIQRFEVDRTLLWPTEPGLREQSGPSLPVGQVRISFHQKARLPTRTAFHEWQHSLLKVQTLCADWNAM